LAIHFSKRLSLAISRSANHQSAVAQNASARSRKRREPTGLNAMAHEPQPIQREPSRDVDLDLKIELGRTQMTLEDATMLGTGSIVLLDNQSGDPVDVLVNDRLIARGEVVVLNNKFCVRVTELLDCRQFSS
jgi:flagellar motor switch protein FliN